MALATIIAFSDRLDPTDAVAALVAERYRAVHVLAVCERPPMVTWWAPLSGGILPGDLAAGERDIACARARALAASFPADVSVEFRVASGWREALALAAERGSAYVLCLGAPRRKRERAAWWRAVAGLSPAERRPARRT